METKAYKDIELSRLGMGVMRLPLLPHDENDPEKDKKIDYEKAQAIIDYAIANGINYFDTAWVYHGGESEVFLGKALKKYDRASFNVATKYYLKAPIGCEEMFEQQLGRLQMDYIDFYLLHGVGDMTIDEYLNNGALDYFKEQKAKGRIKNLGFSYHGSPDGLRKMCEASEWDFVQIQLNYLDWVYDASKAQYDILSEFNIPIVVMEPVRGGRLVNLPDAAKEKMAAAHPEWSTASWALRFVRSLPNVQVILSGMTTMDQIVDNVATFNSENGLSDADIELLTTDAADELKKTISIPCTGCRYCTEACPQGLDIPKLFGVYNAIKYNGMFWGMEFNEIAEDKRANSCLGCGACAVHCPQNIEIPSIMKEITELKAFKP